ncbi:MAG TPA: glycosyltransferase family 4 protein [Thermoplasmata archaeon]|nr:glycosyltransferase family 4 protein [Thermoplasmata archaeon]
MRILRLDSWDGPTVGGAQVYIRRVSQALEAQGHPNVTAAIVTDPVPEKLGPVQSFRAPRSALRRAAAELADGGPLTRWLDQLAAEAKPDVIHLHRFETGFAALGPWLGRRKEPIVFTAHDVEMVCPIATLTLPDGTPCPGGILPRCQFTGCAVGFGMPLNLAKRRSFDTYVKDRVRSFICVSQATRQIFENLGYRPTDLLRPMIPVPDEPAPFPDGPFTVGFLGRFERQKGVDVLLRAFALFRERHPEARLRFAGSGPVSIPSGNGVSLDGWIPDSRTWLGGIHVLAVPSLPWENLGNSPIEALANGVPSVVTEAGGLPETVGRFGTVVPPGDAPALAAALEDVATGYAEAKQLALAGRAWVREEFSTEQHLRRLLAIYTAAATP